MSNRRYSADAGFVDIRKLPRGTNGRALCRRCSTEVPKGRRSFCSDECVHQHRLRTSASYLRECVFKRDAGVCAKCGLDTTRLNKRLLELQKQANLQNWNWQGAVSRSPEQYPELVAFQQQYGWFTNKVSPWAADHIVPVIEGGGECGLENIRTLCVGCHNAETKELRRRLSRKRRDNNRELLAVCVNA